MSDKHTPEPWKYSKDEWGFHYLIENIEKPQGILCDNLSEEDAQRIVQCVNACAGIEDPAKYIADLQSRLDLAVKALEKISQSPHPTCDNEFHIWETVARDIAQDTLTKIKGGADENS